MATHKEKSRVTELHVRMDCNGCVQRIKKALNSIDGVYDVYVDLPQQKLKVVGRIDPETLVKAIKKTKKTATICSYTEPAASEQEPPPPNTEPEATSSPPATDAAAQPPSETPPATDAAAQPPSETPPATDAAAQPPSETPPAEATPPAEPPKDSPPQENPASEEPKPSPQAQGPNAAESKDVDEVHMVHTYPSNHIIREPWNNYPPIGQEIRHEAPYYVTHSYNTNRPSPYVSENTYIRSPPRDMTSHSVESYGEGYYQNRVSEGDYQNRRSDGNQITSMFSDENPNACTIV